MASLTPMVGEVLTPRLDAASITTYALCTSAVALRYLCRRASKTGLWWDDWLSIIIWIPVTSSFITLMVVLRPAAGHHITDISPTPLLAFFKAFYAAQILYVVNIALIKYSILLFYWRLFAVSSRLPLLLMYAIVTVWAIVLAFFLAFQCSPVHEAWTHTDPTKCMDLKTLFIGGSTPNIVTDVVLMLLPIPYLWRLQVRLLQRLLLAGVFVIGGFVAIVSIIRLKVLVDQNLDNPDVTYHLTDVLMWTMVEINVGLLCACLPSLRPVITFLHTGSLFSARNSATGGSYGPKSPGLRLRNHGSKRLFSSTNGLESEEDERGFFKITEAEREMARGVGVDGKKWGQSRADVEVNMDELRQGNDAGRAKDGIEITTDWSVKYDEQRRSGGDGITQAR